MSGKRTAVELENALHDAQERLRMRDEFLRVVGHELRSPLTAVQLHADTLSMLARQGAAAAEMLERAERVKRSVQRLTWLVEEVVDLGRASGLGLALHVAPGDLVQLAVRVLERFADEMRRAGCDARLDATGPVAGSWDGARVEHALGSLLLAAMKSGGGSPIEVEVGESGGTARLSVRDHGHGLPAGERALVYAPFCQVLAGLSPGSPVLALWLARAVAEAHGGQLSITPGLSAIELPRGRQD